MTIKRVGLSFLSFLLVLATAFTLAACSGDENLYTKEEIEVLIAELKESVSDAQTNYNSAINTLKAEYEAEIAALEAANEANKALINAIGTEYNERVRALEANCPANTEALAALKSEYEAKTLELNGLIAENSAKILVLESSLSEQTKALSDTYNKRIAEIEGYITALEETDTASSERIAALEAKINATASAEALAVLKSECEAKTLELNGLISESNGKISALEASLLDKIAALEEQIRGLGSTQGHNYGEWLDYSTDCENRTYYRVCSECGIMELKKGESREHEFITITIPATCTTVGYEDKTCTVCGKTERGNFTEGFGHDEIYHEAKAPCEEIGWDAYVSCSRCEYTTYNELAVTGHDYQATEVPPTCLVGGYTEHKCNNCGKTYKDSLTEATGHTMGSWYQSSFATTTSDEAQMRRNCVNCDIYETKPVEIIAKGDFGKSTTNTGPATSGAYYKLYADGTLKIGGTGATFSCGWNGAAQPYIDYRDSIKRVVIGEGITTAGYGNFCRLKNLETVEYPSTLVQFNDNAFLDAFSSNITSVTIPKTVQSIGTLVFGRHQLGNALITDVIFENPDVLIHQNADGTWLNDNYLKVFNNGTENSSLRLYSYGTDNNVKRYADAIGATYIDLNSMASGEVGNIKYQYFLGKLTLSVIDIESEAALPESMPWLEKIERSSITEIEIGAGITEIPEGYFRGYTGLETVSLPDSLVSLGGMAFATDEVCDAKLEINLPAAIEEIGDNVFKNRQGVSVTAFYGSAAENFEEDGVKVNLKKILRILLIGNSLSQDGADSTVGEAGMLYEIIKSMLGEDSSVEIGVLYSGAKTATWHATTADTEEARYYFISIGDKTDGKWKIVSTSATTKMGLTYAEWDYVTIQPYANEASWGYSYESTDPEIDNRFRELSVSLPFLLDYIQKYAPGADVYYYNTWSNVSDASALNLGETDCVRRLNIAKTAMSYLGTESGEAFAGIIPAGTSIQNARTTYLGLLNYVDGGDVQSGLQRDNVHLSLHVGRYIAALTIAEFLVPEEMRVKNYTLPGIDDSEVIGKLPAEYTEIAQKAVAATVASAKLTGTEQYAPTTLTGYEVDPADVLVKEIEKISFDDIEATTKSEIEAEIAEIIKALAKEGTEISVSVDGDTFDGSFTATVTVSFGYTARQITVSGDLA